METSASRLNTVLLSILTMIAVGVVLLELRVVLVPFVVAVLLSIIFDPIVLFLRRKRIPTALALVFVVLSLALVFFLLGLVFFSTAGSFIESLPQYEARLTRMLRSGLDGLYALAERAGVDIQTIQVTDILPLSALTNTLSSFLNGFLSGMGNVFLMLLFMLFILAGSGTLLTKVRSAYPPDVAERVAGILQEVSGKVRQYLASKTLVSAGTGILTWLFLLILGIDFALIWGLLAFLLNFIPNVGSLIAVGLPLLLSIIQYGGVVRPVLTLVLLGGAQVVMGNVVEPRLLASSLNLSPLLILVSLIYWGWLWGLWGMVLAVPITATIKIFMETLPALQPVAALMSGPPKPRTGRA